MVCANLYRSHDLKGIETIGFAALPATAKKGRIGRRTYQLLFDIGNKNKCRSTCVPFFIRWDAFKNSGSLWLKNV